MTRLPQPGRDDGEWGNILNTYLLKEHRIDGTHDLRQLLNVPAQSARVLMSDNQDDTGITWQTLSKATFQLDNVDNVSDENKPLSIAATAALNTKVSLGGDIGGTSNAPRAKSRTYTYTVGTGSDVADFICDGVSDQVEINAALSAVHAANGGTVYIKPGTYSLSSPIIIYSNTKLEVAHNGIITLAPGANCNMLIDKSHFDGLLAVPSAMTNIEVCGGIWNRGAVGGANLNLHSIIMGGSNIYLHDMVYKSTAAKYAINIQNANNFKIERITAISFNSDVIHVSGPSSFGIVRDIYAYDNGDDIVAFTTNDVIAYQFGNEGDTTDMLVDGVHSEALRVAQIVGIYSGKTTANVPLSTKRITVKNIKGTLSSTANAAVILGDFNSDVVGGGKMDDIIIDGLDASFMADNLQKNIININPNSPSTSLGITTLSIKNVSLHSDCQAAIRNKGPVGKLFVEHVTGATATTSFLGGGSFIWQEGQYATLSQLYISNCDLKSTGIVGGSLIKSIDSGQVLSKVFVSQVTLDSFFALLDVITGTSLMVQGLNLLNCLQQVNSRTGSTITIRSWNGVVSNTTSNGTVSGTIRSISFGFSANAANLSKNAADQVTNSNAALSCGTGMLICDGTNWKNLYSGATY